MWGDALSTKRDEPECKHTNCPIRTHKVLLSQKHHLQDQMRQMPAILCRQHQATYTRPRKSTFKQQKNHPCSSTYSHAKGTSKNAKIKLDIIDNHNDSVNLRLLEIITIRKPKPEINSKEECAELKDFYSDSIIYPDCICFLQRPFVNTSTAFTYLPLSFPIICRTPLI